MKKPKIIRNKRNAKYSGYSLLLTAAFLVAIILVNVAVSALSDRFNLQLDMTQTRMYSLSTQTEQILNNLDNDVYIYTLYASGSEDSDILQILNMYRSESAKIHVESIDMNKNPQSVQAFTTDGSSLQNTSLIVSNADKSRYRIITQYDQYEYSYDDSGNVKMSQLVVESSLTSAINYIDSGYMPNAYFLEGHGEKSLDSLATIQSNLVSENYNVASIDLTTQPDQLQQGDILIIAAPQQDLSDAERELLKGYMDKGGRFLFVMDPIFLNSHSLPNFESLLKIYGLELERGVVMESNLSYTANGSPAYLVPDIQSHDTTDSIISSRIPIVQISGGAIKLPEMSNSAVTITPLLTTSSSAWLETDLSTTSPERDEGEQSGTFTLAVSAEKNNYGEEKDNTKVLLYYGTSILDVDTIANQISSAVAYSNLNLLNNSLAWLKDSEKDIYIRGKSLTQPALVFSNYMQVILVLVVVCIAIPVALFIAGIVVYLRRKNL